MIEPQDESPFMKFGSVSSGQTVPALYNNLIRAPLFRHKAYSTDFLVIRYVVQKVPVASYTRLIGSRTSTKGETKCYIREISNLFVVGQTYPVTEVPGPHSRKITNTIKQRLQIIAFKLLQKSTEKRLKISRLMKYFPDQNELQMRQRLKVHDISFVVVIVSSFDTYLLSSGIHGVPPTRTTPGLLATEGYLEHSLRP